MDDSSLNINRLTKETKEYVEMRIDAAKLRAVEGLVQISDLTIGFVFLVIAIACGLLMFTGALVIWLGKLLDSYIWAFIISGVAYILVGVVVYTLRNKIATNKLVRLYVRLLFKSRERS